MTILSLTSATRNLYASSIVQRIFSNISWGIISQAGGKGLFFIVTVYLARVLGTEEYGLLIYAQSIVLYFWIAADLGVNMYGSREIARAKSEAPDIINPLLTLRIISGLVVFLISMILLNLLVHSPVERLLFTGCAFYLITRSISIDWVMSGFEKFKYIAISNFTTFIAMLLMMLALVKGKDDLVKASFLWSSCYLFGGIVLLVFLYEKLGIRFKPVFHIKTWLLHLGKSIHFTISGGLSALSQYLPIIYLGIFASPNEVGLFSAPYGLIFAIVFVLSLLPYSIYPILSQLHSAEKTTFRKLHKIYLLCSILIGLCIALAGYIFAREIILLLYGSIYEDSIALFKILVWFVFLYSVRSAYGLVIAASGLQRYYTFASSFAVLFFTFMFFLLKFIFGISYPISASISLLATEVGTVLILRFIWGLKNEEH
jgi:O-antigen/teichoic acid export membrane protein